MGTRNLTAVMLDREYRLAQYGQWDGDPEVSGARALTFCREHLTRDAGRAHFMRQLSNVRFVTPGEERELERALRVRYPGTGLTSEEVERRDRVWPYFSRDHGARILQMVYDSTGEILVRNAIAFACNGWCAWAYVVDLDGGTFEVYRGGSGRSRRFGRRFQTRYCKDDLEEIHPPHRAGTWSLDSLPTVEQFLSSLQPKPRPVAQGVPAPPEMAITAAMLAGELS